MLLVFLTPKQALSSHPPLQMVWLYWLQDRDSMPNWYTINHPTTLHTHNETQWPAAACRWQLIFHYNLNNHKIDLKYLVKTVIKFIWNILGKITYETSKMFPTHCVWPSLSQSMCQHILCHTNMLYLWLSRSVHVL